MTTKLMAMILLAGGSLFAQTHVSIGVHFGGPAYYGSVPVAPAPTAVVAYRPPCPGPGYVWIDGYREGYGNWFDGYWATPPYSGAYWVAPRLVGGHFYAGYWGGARRRDRDDFRFRESRERERRERESREHNRDYRDRGRFDRDHDRDFDRGRDYGRGFRR